MEKNHMSDSVPQPTFVFPTEGTTSPSTQTPQDDPMGTGENMRDLNDIKQEIALTTMRRRSTRLAHEKHDVATEADILPQSATHAVIQMHERVQLFYHLIQNWVEDNSFPFIEEWVGEIEDDAAAQFAATAEEKENQLLLGLRAQVRCILEDTDIDEEHKVTKLSEVSKQQKMLLLKRIRRMKELNESQSSQRRAKFRDDNGKAIDSTAHVEELVHEDNVLYDSLNALLGKVFVFLRACVEKERVPRPSRILWGGEQHRSLMGLSGIPDKVKEPLKKKVPFDMIDLPNDLDELYEMAATGFKFPFLSLQEAKKAQAEAEAERDAALAAAEAARAEAAEALASMNDVISNVGAGSSSNTPASSSLRRTNSMSRKASTASGQLSRKSSAAATKTSSSARKSGASTPVDSSGGTTLKRKNSLTNSTSIQDQSPSPAHLTLKRRGSLDGKLTGSTSRRSSLESPALQGVARRRSQVSIVESPLPPPLTEDQHVSQHSKLEDDGIELDTLSNSKNTTGSPSHGESSSAPSSMQPAAIADSMLTSPVIPTATSTMSSQREGSTSPLSIPDPPPPSAVAGPPPQPSSVAALDEGELSFTVKDGRQVPVPSKQGSSGSLLVATQQPQQSLRRSGSLSVDSNSRKQSLREVDRIPAAAHQTERRNEATSLPHTATTPGNQQQQLMELESTTSAPSPEGKRHTVGPATTLPVALQVHHRDNNTHPLSDTNSNGDGEESLLDRDEKPRFPSMDATSNPVWSLPTTPNEQHVKEPPAAMSTTGAPAKGALGAASPTAAKQQHQLSDSTMASRNSASGPTQSEVATKEEKEEKERTDDGFPEASPQQQPAEQPHQQEQQNETLGDISAISLVGVKATGDGAHPAPPTSSSHLQLVADKMEAAKFGDQYRGVIAGATTRDGSGGVVAASEYRPTQQQYTKNIDGTQQQREMALEVRSKDYHQNMYDRFGTTVDVKAKPLSDVERQQRKKKIQVAMQERGSRADGGVGGGLDSLRVGGGGGGGGDADEVFPTPDILPPIQNRHANHTATTQPQQQGNTGVAPASTSHKTQILVDANADAFDRHDVRLQGSTGTNHTAKAAAGGAHALLYGTTDDPDLEGLVVTPMKHASKKTDETSEKDPQNLSAAVDDEVEDERRRSTRALTLTTQRDPRKRAHPMKFDSEEEQQRFGVSMSAAEQLMVDAMIKCRYVASEAKQRQKETSAIQKLTSTSRLHDEAAEAGEDAIDRQRRAASRDLSLPTPQPGSRPGLQPLVFRQKKPKNSEDDAGQEDGVLGITDGGMNKQSTTLSITQVGEESPQPWFNHERGFTPSVGKGSKPSTALGGKRPHNSKLLAIKDRASTTPLGSRDGKKLLSKVPDHTATDSLMLIEDRDDDVASTASSSIASILKDMNHDYACITTSANSFEAKGYFPVRKDTGQSWLARSKVSRLELGANGGGGNDASSLDHPAMATTTTTPQKKKKTNLLNSGVKPLPEDSKVKRQLDAKATLSTRQGKQFSYLHQRH